METKSKIDNESEVQILIQQNENLRQEIGTITEVVSLLIDKVKGLELLLVNHNNKVRKVSKPSVYKCPHCDHKPYKSFRPLNTHIQRYHMN